MLSELRKTIHEQNENINKEKCILKIQKYWGWEYNNWVEKFTRGVQQQNWSTKRKNQQTQTGHLYYPLEEQKEKKKTKTMKRNEKP